MIKNTTKNKLITFSIILVLIVAILYGIFVFFSRNDKTILTIQSAPARVNLTLNDKRINRFNGTVHLDPGTYNIVIDREGFESYTDTITVNEENINLQVGLTPLTADARNIAERESQRYTDLEAIAGEQAALKGQEIRLENPIITVLPHKSVLYTIDYSIEEDENVVIEISANTANNRSQAIKKIKNLGYEPSDYYIKFTNLTSLLPTMDIRSE